jgi:hypothetical protein
MPRFLFHANSFAVGGHITRPFDRHIDSQAACALPTCGGRTSGQAGPYKLNDPASGRLILSYDSAETAAIGEADSSGAHQTTVSSKIRNFNVLDVLKADEIIFHVVLTHNGGAHSAVDTTNSRFVNLTISGQPFDVGLEHTKSHDAADYDAFRKKYPEHRESHGRVLHSLGKHPALKFGDEDFGYLDVPDFGRIYFAEWIVAPETQALTMLRLQLGSPVAGRLAIGGGNGNGTSYP